MLPTRTYVGPTETGRNFKNKMAEHRRAVRKENNTSSFAQHLTAEKDTTVILWISRFYTKQTQEESWTDWRPRKLSVILLTSIKFKCIDLHPCRISLRSALNWARKKGMSRRIFSTLFRLQQP